MPRTLHTSPYEYTCPPLTRILSILPPPLSHAKVNPRLITKTSVMLGLGETDEEVRPRIIHTDTKHRNNTPKYDSPAH